MTDLTLEEFRDRAPGQDVSAMLRNDAFLIWGPHKVSHKPVRDLEPKKKGRFPAWATRFLRLSLRAS
jgi:hypothetical protein